MVRNDFSWLCEISALEVLSRECVIIMTGSVRLFCTRFIVSSKASSPEREREREREREVYLF